MDGGKGITGKRPCCTGDPVASERDRLSEQEGQPLFDLVEDVRGLAKAYRAGDEAAGERLLRRVEVLPLAE